jgi:ketol-acid reductoisomerase
MLAVQIAKCIPRAAPCARRAGATLVKNVARPFSLLATRAAIASSLASSSAAARSVGQTRGVKTVDFAGTKEVVYERSDWPVTKLQEYFKNDTLAIIGYGSQGHGQGLNARDSGLNVIIGVREDGASWKEAISDGWVRLLARDDIGPMLETSIRYLERPFLGLRRPSGVGPSS